MKPEIAAGGSYEAMLRTLVVADPETRENQRTALGRARDSLE